MSPARAGARSTAGVPPPRARISRFERLAILWSGLSRSGRVALIGAIFSTFCSVGFLVDVFNVHRQQTPAGLAAQVVTAGGASVLYFVCGIFRRRLLPLVVFVHVGLVLLLGVWLPSHKFASDALVRVSDLELRFAIDGAGIMIGIVLGYGLFITLLAREGFGRVRLTTEMELAQDIHRTLVPMVERTSGRVEVYGRSDPSSEVGGDLLDVTEREGRTLVCVADVAGHGVRAGTLMAMILSAIRVRLLTPGGLEGLFSDLNEVLLQLERPDMFVTIAALRFGASGEAEVALAGHPDILRIRSRDGGIERMPNPNVPLGVGRGRAFEVSRVACERGDLFALYTDGLTEVRDALGEEFGVARLEQAIVAAAAKPLAQAHASVIAAVRGHGNQDDDQTLVLVRVI